MDCRLPDSSVHTILQARILEWVAISFSRGSSPPRGWTHISCFVRWFLYHWATREAHDWYCITILKYILTIHCIKITFLCNCVYFVLQIFPVAQTVKNLPAVRETWVQSLGWKDPLEKGMTIHSSILAWTIPWTEGPGGPQSMGLQRVRYDWATNTILCFKHLQIPFWGWLQASPACLTRGTHGGRVEK